MPQGAGGRIASLDLIRGVAVLGILAINIAGFAGPSTAPSDIDAPTPASAADTIVFALNLLLFEGKMRGLFSLLFGASMAVFLDRIGDAGKPAELLQVRNVKGGFFGWLRKRFLANVPMDRVVRELLTAEGGFFRDPPAQYFRRVGKPKVLAENVAQVFMGTRIQCAQCHNHPFDRWTMNDYYGFAAFFAQLGSKRNWEDTREQIVFNKGSGEVRHPIDDRVMAPKFLGGAVPKLAGRDRRAVLAEWLTSAENPWFASRTLWY